MAAGGIKHSVATVPSGTVLFKDGDPRQALYIVQKGQIAIFKLGPNGERLPLGIVSSGEYLGETGLIDGKKNHATFAVALTDVEMIKIPVDAIEEQLKTIPPWLLSMCRGLAQKLRNTNEIVRRNQVSDQRLDEAMLAVQESQKKKGPSGE